MKKGPKLAQEVRRLSALPDSKIDTSDIPEVTDWTGAVRGRFYRPGAKHLLPVFVEADVVEVLAEEAKRRDTDVNSLGTTLLRRGVRTFTSGKRRSATTRYRKVKSGSDPD